LLLLFLCASRDVDGRNKSGHDDDGFKRPWKPSEL
jgi:hypothetical protein